MEAFSLQLSPVIRPAWAAERNPCLPCFIRPPASSVSGRKCHKVDFLNRGRLQSRPSRRPRYQPQQWFVCAVAQSTNERSNCEFPANLLSSPPPPPSLQYFATEAVDGTLAALKAGLERIQVAIVVPSLDSSVDAFHQPSVVYVMREVLLAIAREYPRVKLCIQTSGSPILASFRRTVEFDLERSDMMRNVSVGGIGPQHADSDSDVFILLCPTNTQVDVVVEDAMAMSPKIGARPLVMLNPRLEDITSDNGRVMGMKGREQRIAFLKNFDCGYYFRLLYKTGTDFPVQGILRRRYPGPWQVYKKTSFTEYELLDEINSDSLPDRQIVADSFSRALRSDSSSSSLSIASMPAYVPALAAIGFAVTCLAALSLAQ